MFCHHCLDVAGDSWGIVVVDISFNWTVFCGNLERDMTISPGACIYRVLLNFKLKFIKEYFLEFKL